MFIFKKYFGPNLMLRNQNIKDFPYNLVYFFNTVLYMENNDFQFNSFIKGMKNSFLIKRLIQVPSSGSCIVKVINKYFCLIEVCHYTLSIEY